MSNNFTNVEEEKLSKEELITRYARALDEVEKALEPFREHRKDLRASYIQNGWLTKEETSMVLKAYRQLKSGEDLGEISHYVDMIKGKL